MIPTPRDARARNSGRRCAAFLGPRVAGVIALACAAAGCGGDPSRSPACGLALVAGPTLVQQQLNNARAVIVEPPRGLPERLPARVAGRNDQGVVLVGYAQSHLVMGYEGANFPTLPGYALLVVDDTSQRATGVLIYDREGPTQHPRLGSVHGGTGLELPLFGVTVDWAGVSNPRCPLLGPPTTPEPS